MNRKKLSFSPLVHEVGVFFKFLNLNFDRVFYFSINDTIKKKTRKTPEDFKALAINKGYFENGILKPTVNAAEAIAWLKEDFGLGHGHSLAIYHSLREEANE